MIFFYFQCLYSSAEFSAHNGFFILHFYLRLCKHKMNFFKKICADKISYFRVPISFRSNIFSAVYGEKIRIDRIGMRNQFSLCRTQPNRKKLMPSHASKGIGAQYTPICGSFSLLLFYYFLTFHRSASEAPLSLRGSTVLQKTSRRRTAGSQIPGAGPTSDGREAVASRPHVHRKFPFINRLVRIMGVEPIRVLHRYLKPACLPIPPYPHRTNRRFCKIRRYQVFAVNRTNARIFCILSQKQYK